MTDQQRDFEQFMKQREEAARAYVRGDAKPLGGVTAPYRAGDLLRPAGRLPQERRGPPHPESDRAPARQARPVPMSLRVTETFRREGGEWKLVHRHADTLTAAPRKSGDRPPGTGAATIGRMKPKLYGIRNCDTMKKAFAWLEARKIAYDFHDYKKDGVPPRQARGVVAPRGLKRHANTRGPTWRDFPRRSARTRPKRGRSPCSSRTPARSGVRSSRPVRNCSSVSTQRPTPSSALSAFSPVAACRTARAARPSRARARVPACAGRFFPAPVPI